MYFDNVPCDVCGSEVRLQARTTVETGPGPVGPADGAVGDADSTVDVRVCTNPDCPTNGGGSAAGTP